MSSKQRTRRRKSDLIKSPLEKNDDVNDKVTCIERLPSENKEKRLFTTFLKKDYITMGRQKGGKKYGDGECSKIKRKSWPSGSKGEVRGKEELDKSLQSDQAESISRQSRKRKGHKSEGFSHSKQIRQSRSEDRGKASKGRRSSSAKRESNRTVDADYAEPEDNANIHKDDNKEQRRSFQPQVLPIPSSRKSQYKLVQIDSSDCTEGNNISAKPNEEMRCEIINGGCLLLFHHPKTLSFHGKAVLSVLCGKVSLFGHKMTPESSPVKVFSPSSHSLITISSETGHNLSQKSIMKSSCQKHCISKRDTSSFLLDIREDSVVLLLNKIDSSCCDFVSECPPFKTLFGKNSPEQHHSSFPSINEALSSIDSQVGCITDTSLPVMNIPAEFKTVSDKVMMALDEKEDFVKVLSCGGKNAGKSTLNRYLINSTLQRTDSVCYLDCDVGQTEFTPPGCIALHQINTPVLGPPFTHQQDPHYMCFFGLVSPSENPRLYSNCVQQVYEEYQRLNPKPPLIINTMGWNKGLGVNLLVDICHITCPGIIVQLESMNQANNFPAITRDFVHASPGWLYNRDAQIGDEEPRFHHELIIIDSPVVPSIESQLRFLARDHRDLTILGYFSRCLRSGQRLQEVKPFCVPWKHLALHTCHAAVPPSQILAAINASIVALCVADLSKAKFSQDQPGLPLHLNKTPVCQCLGLGIVRGIDMVKQEIYLITPVQLPSLQRVNTLIRGSVNLPEQVLLKQKSDGCIPYVGTHLSMIGASSVRPRRYMPRKRLGPTQ